MRLQEAKDIAKELMSEHLTTDWTFKFTDRKSSLGVCHFRTKEISLSTYMIPSMDMDIVMDTVLHEIAHALVGFKHRHNHVWYSMARSIGCSGERTSSIEVVNKTSKYMAECPDCGHTHHKHRKSNRRHCCKCLGSFDSSRTLNYIQQF